MPTISINTILIIAHSQKADAIHLAGEISAFLKQRNVTTRIAYLPKEHIDSANANLVITLGGDGTVLSAARVSAPIPLLPINLGKIGFVTEFSKEGWQEELAKVLQGEVQIVERSMLTFDLEGRTVNPIAGNALNDIVVSGSGISKLLNLAVRIDEDEKIDYRADGIICSTATGSTAYSAAAGGPILHPDVEAIIVNPICPFTLSHRPLVLPKQVRLRIDLLTEQSTEIMLTVDGQDSYELKPGDRLHISSSEIPVRIVHSKSRNFYKVLRTKLNWAGGATEENP